MSFGRRTSVPVTGRPSTPPRFDRILLLSDLIFDQETDSWVDALYYFMDRMEMAYAGRAEIPATAVRLKAANEFVGNTLNGGCAHALSISRLAPEELALVRDGLSLVAAEPHLAWLERLEAEVVNLSPNGQALLKDNRQPSTAEKTRLDAHNDEIFALERATPLGGSIGRFLAGSGEVTLLDMAALDARMAELIDAMPDYFRRAETSIHSPIGAIAMTGLILQRTGKRHVREIEERVVDPHALISRRRVLLTDGIYDILYHPHDWMELHDPRSGALIDRVTDDDVRTFVTRHPALH